MDNWTQSYGSETSSLLLFHKLIHSPHSYNSFYFTALENLVTLALVSFNRSKNNYDFNGLDDTNFI
jgi:hypothetical protein